jgi:serine/threonine protein phosphatase 1
MKTFVIGDIHGAAKALDQCLVRANFDFLKDILVCLGDVADGWPETPQVIEKLLELKNLILVQGNHDFWLEGWLQFGARPVIWTEQGGQATIEAYLKEPELMVKHRDFFKKAVGYALDDKNRIYVHGGFCRGIAIASQLREMLMWDRTLADKTAGAKEGDKFLVHEYGHVFLGHTSVNNYKKLPKNKPYTGGNVTLLDTGAGWEGVLTIMNVNTMKYWQSDLVSELYPESRGRN